MKKLLFAAAAAAMILLMTAVGCKKAETPVEDDPRDVAVSTQYAASPASEREAHKHDTHNSGATKQTPDPGDPNHQSTALKEETTLTVNCDQVFKESGFYCFTAGCGAEYTVTVTPGAGSGDWQVFVLDEKFADAVRYIPQAHEPALTGSGTVTVTAGQYVYLYCTVNSFTASEPAEGCSVTVTGRGVPTN